jgi:hypothetical protein
MADGVLLWWLSSRAPGVEARLRQLKRDRAAMYQLRATVARMNEGGWVTPTEEKPSFSVVTVEEREIDRERPPPWRVLYLRPHQRSVCPECPPGVPASTLAVRFAAPDGYIHRSTVAGFRKMAIEALKRVRCLMWLANYADRCGINLTIHHAMSGNIGKTWPRILGRYSNAVQSMIMMYVPPLFRGDGCAPYLLRFKDSAAQFSDPDDMETVARSMLCFDGVCDICMEEGVTDLKFSFQCAHCVCNTCAVLNTSGKCPTCRAPPRSGGSRGARVLYR